MKKSTLKKLIRDEDYKDNIQYTGFTTKCRSCGKEVKCTYIGQNEDNVACYELTCGCGE